MSALYVCTYSKDEARKRKIVAGLKEGKHGFSTPPLRCLASELTNRTRFHFKCQPHGKIQSQGPKNSAGNSCVDARKNVYQHLCFLWTISATYRE